MRRSWLDTDADDGGWIAHRLKLMLSPPWRRRPIPLCRLLERIEIEHLRHAGKENGRLCVSYGQLVDYGISRRVIRPAVVAGQRLGLLAVTIAEDGAERRQRTKPQADRMEPPNLYRLTYVPEKGKRAPSDEWASVTEEAAAEVVTEFQKATGAKANPQFPFPQATSSLSGGQTGSTSSLSRTSPVPERELSIISATSPTDAARGAKVAPPSIGGALNGGDRASGPIPISAALASTPAVRRLLKRAGAAE